MTGSLKVILLWLKQNKIIYLALHCNMCLPDNFSLPLLLMLNYLHTETKKNRIILFYKIAVLFLATTKIPF